MTELQRIVRELQTALDISVVTGSITLNLHESELKNIRTETFQTVTARKSLTTPSAEPTIRHSR